MIPALTNDLPSLGLESKEYLGFNSDQDLENALEALAKEVIKEEQTI